MFGVFRLRRVRSRRQANPQGEKLRYAICLYAVLLSGCAHQLADSEGGPAQLSVSQLAHENQLSLLKLSIGLKKADVVGIMGTKSASTRDGDVANPFRSETFQDTAGNQYEVLYYVTERNRRFQPLRLGQTTPIVLQDGAVVGWGAEAIARARGRTR